MSSEIVFERFRSGGSRPDAAHRACCLARLEVDVLEEERFWIGALVWVARTYRSERPEFAQRVAEFQSAQRGRLGSETEFLAFIHDAFRRP